MTDELLGELFMIVITPILALWPYFFIQYKKGENHFLFVAAFYGAFVVATMLFSAIALPFGIFLVKLLPQLEAHGIGGYLSPLAMVCEAVADWFWALLFSVLYIALPPLVYRRYGIFRSTNVGKGRS